MVVALKQNKDYFSPRKIQRTISLVILAEIHLQRPSPGFTEATVQRSTFPEEEQMLSGQKKSLAKGGTRINSEQAESQLDTVTSPSLPSSLQDDFTPNQTRLQTRNLNYAIMLMVTGNHYFTSRARGD